MISEGVPPSRSSSLAAIQRALEAAGIEFIGTPTDAPGIRLRTLDGQPSADA